jgi:hypothetical protein
MKKKDLSLRRRTSLYQKLANNFIEKGHGFSLPCNKSAARKVTHFVADWKHQSNSSVLVYA